MVRTPTQTAEALPGYRRVIEVEARAGCVTAMLEDDFHCMAVTLRHDGGRVTAVEPFADRMPWSTCPGAVAKLKETFEGTPLEDVTARKEKKSNCTHLHDMAVLAAAHAGDVAGEGAGTGNVKLRFEIVASDPREGVRLLECRRNGRSMHFWVERDGVLTEPPAIEGLTLFSLRDWIAGLGGDEQECARLLQWASIVAHGRTIAPENQRTASELPANCYTFQTERARHAQRSGVSFDFSEGSRVPLDGLRGRMRATRPQETPGGRHAAPDGWEIPGWK